MAVEADDSFKKPGAIPFKWEIRPGVPKVQQQKVQHQKQQQKQLSPPILPSPSPPFHHQRPSTPAPQQKLKPLKPPPAGFIFLPPPEPRTPSFRSAPRARSERWRFEQPTLVRPQSISPGCFPSPLLRRKEGKSRGTTRTAKPGCEPDYFSDLETLSRWSFSSRKSVSPFRESSASPFSSYQSSPRAVGDAEWAGFGLF